MEQAKVQEHFRKQAADYVGLMERLVPKFSEQNAMLCELIPFEHGQPIRVLDLGSGPGVLAELVLERFPQARVLAFDLTEEMLAACRQRLSRFAGRLELRQGDYQTDSFGSGYDVILAGLTLHHLEDAARLKMFARLYAALSTPGIFLAKEIVVEEDPAVTEWHYSLWRSFMQAGGEDAAFWYAKHREKDHPVAVSKQLEWLRQAGFVRTACHWRYWNFAIISGQKGNDLNIPDGHSERERRICLSPRS